MPYRCTWSKIKDPLGVYEHKEDLHAVIGVLCYQINCRYLFVATFNFKVMAAYVMLKAKQK